MRCHILSATIRVQGSHTSFTLKLSLGDNLGGNGVLVLHFVCGVVRYPGFNLNQIMCIWVWDHWSTGWLLLPWLPLHRSE